ncbi:hypothetical protein ROSI111154_07515 [Rouxiella silvae]
MNSTPARSGGENGPHHYQRGAVKFTYYCFVIFLEHLTEHFFQTFDQNLAVLGGKYQRRADF